MALHLDFDILTLRCILLRAFVLSVSEHFVISISVSRALTDMNHSEGKPTEIRL